MDKKKLIALIAMIITAIAGAGWFGLDAVDAPIIIQHISGIIASVSAGIVAVVGIIVAVKALWKMIADKVGK